MIGYRQRGARGEAAFTLVEVMVAAAVLALLVVLLASLLGNGSTLLRTSRRELDAYGQMRVVLDRIQDDFRRAEWREDTDPAFSLAQAFALRPGNDAFLFLSHVKGYSGDRNLSVVGYRLAAPAVDAGGHIAVLLQRGVTGTSWEGGVLFSFGHGGGAPPGTPVAVPDADYETLADSVVRMEVCFVEKGTGKVRTSLDGLAALHGVVVTLAALDPDTLRRQAGTASVAALAGLLPDAADGGADFPLAAWQRVADGAATQPAATRGLLQTVRFLQRQFYVRP